MKTSAAGRAAIAQREGNKLKAYKDSVGIWTIGVGHTAAAGPPAPKAGMTITAAQSDEILARDIPKYEKPVNDAVKVPLTQNQFDALVSLAFNIGGGAFAKSTLVKKLNKRDYGGAAAAFMSWDKAGGKRIPGLTTRRNAERKQFLATSTPASGKPAPAVDIPTIEPKPAPAPVPASDKEMIARVQTGLTLLKYNPGGADGLLGPLTKGAILAFRNDHDLPPGDFIDEELIEAIGTATPREMVPARANATGSEIAAKIPEANAHSWIKTIAGGGGGTLAIGALTDAVAPAKGYVDQIREMAPDIPGYVYLGIGALFLIGIAYMALHGQKASDEAFRTGDRR